MRNKKGFTLIEVLLVIVIIAILAGIVIIAVNPGRQISQANDAQRTNDVRAILDAVHQSAIENRGAFPTSITGLADPTVSTEIGDTAGMVDICADLVPDFLVALPTDPTDAAATYVDCDTAYVTGYFVSLADGRITVDAPGAEVETTIAVTR